MTTTSGSSNYTHSYDSFGGLSFCSEAVDVMHYFDDGRAVPTGWGFCPHHLLGDPPAAVPVVWDGPTGLRDEDFT